MNSMKVISAQQARITHRYKNTKDKLPKASAAMWLNEMCGRTATFNT
jgi:hypothetical protein